MRMIYPIESSHLNLKFYSNDEVQDIDDGSGLPSDYLFDGILMQRLEIKTEMSSFTYISLGYFGLTKIVTKIGGFNAATFSLFNLLFGSLFSAMFLNKIGEKLAKTRNKADGES